MATAKVMAVAKELDLGNREVAACPALTGMVGITASEESPQRGSRRLATGIRACRSPCLHRLIFSDDNFSFVVSWQVFFFDVFFLVYFLGVVSQAQCQLHWGLRFAFVVRFMV